MPNSRGFEIVEGKERERVEEYLAQRFGIDQDYLKQFRMFSHGNIYYLVAGDRVGEVDIRHLKHIGLRAVRLSSKGVLKPTTDLIQALGPYMTRGVVRIWRARVMDFINGAELRLDTELNSDPVSRGYVAVATEDGGFLGCGFFDGTYLKSMVPKDRSVVLG